MPKDDGEKRLSLDVPRVKRQLGIQNPTLYPKLLQKQLDAVPAVGVVDKDEALAFDEAEFEDDVEEEELVFFGAAVRVGICQ